MAEDNPEVKPEVVAPQPEAAAIPPPSRVERRALLPAQPGDPMPSVTTVEEDINTAGQRKINLIWEYTQATIAIGVVGASIIVGGWLAIDGRGNEFPVILTSLVMLVVGFYFSRTNHAAIGGIGLKPKQEYMGR